MGTDRSAALLRLDADIQRERRLHVLPAPTAFPHRHRLFDLLIHLAAAAR